MVLGTVFAIALAGSSTVAAAEPASVVAPHSVSIAATGWTTFLYHEVDSVDRLLGAVNKLANAADNGSWSGMKRGARALRNWGSSEVSWLNNHSPRSCYGNVWSAMLKLAKVSKRAGSLILSGLNNYDIDTMEAGVNQFGRVPGLVDRVTRAMKNATC
jgi:hypothetical protein